VELERLRVAFVEAFSDYQVRIDMPPWKFEGMLRRRGFVPRLSVGAFDGDEPVGLLLNAVRQWGGMTTAYDCGTGVVPAHRRTGLTTRMFAAARDALRAAGVRQYLLEVLKANEGAVALYTKEGFTATRSLVCYAGPREAVAGAPSGGARIEEAAVADLDWEEMRAFWDFEPSWQNSVDSIMAGREGMRAAIGRVGGDVAGYSVVEERTGDVPQLAVARGHRRAGVGRELLRALGRMTTSPRLAVLNVEGGPTGLHALLAAAGLPVLVEQHEMALPM
jgi:ribosomal protein S18 acetylase RimI-like enzyme